MFYCCHPFFSVGESRGWSKHSVLWYSCFERGFCQVILPEYIIFMHVIRTTEQLGSFSHLTCFAKNRRNGKRSLQGIFNDGRYALSRYYLNNFCDGEKQVGIHHVNGHLLSFLYMCYIKIKARNMKIWEVWFYWSGLRHHI